MLAAAAGRQRMSASLVEVMFGQRAPRIQQQQSAWKPVNIGVQRIAFTSAAAAGSEVQPKSFRRCDVQGWTSHNVPQSALR